MNYTRRDLGMLLPLLGSGAALAQEKTVPARVFRYEDLPVRVSGLNKARAVVKGETHDEMLLLERGTVDVTIDGHTTRLTPGSVAYVASNHLHGWKNAGDGPAEYFVVALGRDDS